MIAESYPVYPRGNTVPKAVVSEISVSHSQDTGKVTEKIGVVPDVSGGEDGSEGDLPEWRRGRRRDLREARANLGGRREEEGGARRQVGGKGLLRLQDCGKFKKLSFFANAQNREW